MIKITELYACLHATEFPAQALLRLRPEFRGKPCVVLDGQAPLQHVCSLTRKARALGVAHGMTRVQVDMVPGVTVLSRSATEESAVERTLLKLAGGFSPRIENLSRDGAFLCIIDVAGTEKLFGPPEMLAQNLLRHVRSLGITASIAVSRNFHAAICLAKGLSPQTARVVPVGNESRELATLPLEVLDLTEEQAETFSQWGIRTLGMLAALPEKELVARIGQSGSRLRQLARGERPHLFQPLEADSSLEEFMELESPVEQLDSLLFIVSSMLDQLIFCAKSRVLALASVTIALRLEGERAFTRKVRSALPSNDKQLWIKLLHLDLEAHLPQAGILALTITAEPGNTSKVQLGLYSPQVPEPTRLDVTLARIQAIVGTGNVGRAELSDTHEPDRFTIAPFTLSFGSSCLVSPTWHKSGVRKIRPAETVWVVMQGKYPRSFIFREKHYSIERAYGPWLLNGDWWRPELWSQEQWDLIARAHDNSLLFCCLIHNPIENCWKMAAFYD